MSICELSTWLHIQFYMALGQNILCVTVPVLTTIDKIHLGSLESDLLLVNEIKKGEVKIVFSNSAHTAKLAPQEAEFLSRRCLST